MRTTINVEETKEKIDYQALVEEIVTLSQTGGLQRQNPVAALLDPVKDAILAARQNKASIRALVRFFRQKGIPVSEASLRRYLREQTNEEKSRRRARGRAHRTGNKPASEPSAVPRNPGPPSAKT